MKPRRGDVVRTTTPVTDEFSGDVLEPGILGDVIEVLHAREGLYSVDLAIPEPQLVGGYRYVNVVLRPDQVVVVLRNVERAESAAQAG